MLTMQKRVKAEGGIVSFRLPEELQNMELDVFVCQANLSSEKTSGGTGKKHMKDVLGSWQGKMKIAFDFDAPLDDFKEYM